MTDTQPWSLTGSLPVTTTFTLTSTSTATNITGSVTWTTSHTETWTKCERRGLSQLYFVLNVILYHIMLYLCYFYVIFMLSYTIALGTLR